MADLAISLLLRLKNETQGVFAEVKKQVNDLGKSFNAATPSGNFSRVGEEAKTSSLSIKSLATGVTDLSDRSNALSNTLKGVVTGLLALSAVRFLKELADGAARTQVLGTVLETVAVNAGISASEIQKVDEQVQRLGITSAASKTALTAFIQSGLDIKGAAPLARAAQDLAVVAGKNSSDLFQNIILNIQQLDTMGLRYNGVVLDMAQVTAKYAKELNTTADALTNSQRQQAVLNGALEKSKEVAGIYEKSLGDVGKQLDSLKRYTKEASDSAGSALLPAYLVIVQEFTTFLKQSKALTDEFTSQGEAARQLAEKIKPIAVALREGAKYILENIELIGTLVKYYLILQVGSAVIGGLLTSWKLLAPVIVGIGESLLWIANLVFPAFTAAATASIAEISTALAAAVAKNPLLLVMIVTLGYAINKMAQEYLAAQRAKEKFEKESNAGVDPTLSKIEQEKRLHQLYVERATLIGKIDSVQRESDAAVKKGDSDEIAATKLRLEQGKARKAQLDATIKATEKLASAQGTDIDSTKATADANLAKNAILKNATDIQLRLKAMKLDSEEQFKGIDISSEFLGQMGKMQATVRDFRDKTKGDISGGVAVTFGQAYLAVKNFAEGAKSVAEITLALRQLEAQAAILGKGVLKDLIDTTSFRLGKAVISETNAALEGFLETSKLAQANSSRLAGVATDTTKFVSGVRETIALLGTALSVSADGVMQYSGSVSALTSGVESLTRAQLSASQVLAEDSKRRYTEALSNLEEEKNKKKIYLNGEIAAGRVAVTALVALEKEIANKSIEINKARYDELRKLQADYTSRVTDSYSKIASLEKDLTRSTKSESKDLYEIQTQGITGVQKVSSDFNRLRLLEEQTLQARIFQGGESEKDLIQERIALAKQIATSADASPATKIAAAQALSQAYKEQRDEIKAAKALEEERLRLNLEAQNAIVKELQNVAQVFGELGKTSELKIKVDKKDFDNYVERVQAGNDFIVKAVLDQNSIQNLRAQLQEGLKDIQVSFTGVLETVGKAAGGPIRGPGTGTSDSILMYGSNGEFVMTAAATRHYGENFMHDVNNRTFRRSLVPGFAEGGPVGGSGESGSSVSLSLTFNNRPIGAVRGSRATVNSLIDALSEISRGVS